MTLSTLMHTRITRDRVIVEVAIPSGLDLDEAQAVALDARLQRQVADVLDQAFRDKPPRPPRSVEVNRRGVTRTVLLIGRWAVKIPSLRGGSIGRRWMRSLVWGIDANLREIEWSGMPNVCPVRWSLLGLVNVYPRCAPLPADRDLVAADWEALGMEHLSDRKRENVGLLGGHLVWLDYA